MRGPSLRLAHLAWRACVWIPACVGMTAWACPAPEQVTAADVLGLWRADFPGSADVALLLVEPNPRWPGSLAGTVSRQGRRAEVSGDVERGEFTLEESDDGTRVSGTWVGQFAAGACGREIRGTWQGDARDAERPFVLRWLGPR